jgi:hypothetical protein
MKTYLKVFEELGKRRAGSARFREIFGRSAKLFGLERIAGRAGRVKRDAQRGKLTSGQRIERGRSPFGRTC